MKDMPVVVIVNVTFGSTPLITAVTRATEEEVQENLGPKFGDLIEAKIKACALLARHRAVGLHVMAEPPASFPPVAALDPHPPLATSPQHPVAVPDPQPPAPVLPSEP